MTLSIHCITVDCREPRSLAAWWAKALGYTVDEAGSNDDEVAIRGEGPALLFIRVPEAKVVKNRLHLDLDSDDRDAEVARLNAMGARRADIGQRGEESWVVLADPEGNELCVLRPRGS